MPKKRVPKKSKKGKNQKRPVKRTKVEDRSSKSLLSARNLFRNGSFMEAATILEGIVRRDPGSFDAIALLASCYHFQGNYEGAVKCHETSVKTDPSDAQRWHSLASALMNIGSLEEAEKAMKEAIRLDGNRGSSHYNLARIIARKGDNDGAITSLRKAIKLQPDLRESMTDQPDFAPLAEDDRFKELAGLKKEEFDYPFFERGEA